MKVGRAEIGASQTSAGCVRSQHIIQSSVWEWKERQRQGYGSDPQAVPVGGYAGQAQQVHDQGPVQTDK